MRLIDKDSLFKSLYERFVDDEVKICLQEFWHGIEVEECIEAEKEVDAIPVEWIEKWMDEFLGVKLEEEITNLDQFKKNVYQGIMLMYNDWNEEKETEHYQKDLERRK